MAEARQPTLLGRLLVKGEVEALTGIHIGGNDSGIGIGGVDKVVVRNAFDNRPYIPGSSLKGKMRSLIERARALPQNAETKRGRTRMECILMHRCETQNDYDKCAVCNLFGVPSNWEDKDAPPYPTRIVVRDCRLVNHEELLSQTEIPYTEAKTEVSIDRLTSAANPRQFERVPAGAIFRLELAVNFYTTRDINLANTLLFAMGLVEGDYLGGQGTRGYGQVAFKNLKAEMEWFNGQESELPEWVNELKDGVKDLAGLPWKEYATNDGFLD